MPAPITLASNDQLDVELFGTRFRHLSPLSDISVQVGGQNVPVQYAAAQGADRGLDQINL